MRAYLLLISLLVSLFASSQTQLADKRIVSLEPQLEKILKDWNAAGFAVAVVEKNKIIYSKGFGFRDMEKKLPVTPNTLFAIGSCTKAFTSSLIGLLAQEKLVELDKPVHNYLPAIKFFNTGMTNNITLRDMMSHRTGLPRHDISWYLFPSSRDTLIKRIEFMEPTAGIKERWQYNNFMFLLQGMIAEKVTSESWEKNIQRRLLDPLGMKRSNFSVFDMAKDNDAAIGYGLKSDSIIKKLDYFNTDAIGPAGSINSSVNEMSQWVLSWINNGKVNGKTLLPESYVKDAMSSQMIINAGFPDKEIPDVYFSNYGLGWILSSYRGHYRVEHGGNIDGFSANTSFFPTDSIGIIVLSNQNGSVIPTLVRNLIADKILNLTPIDWNANRKKAVEKSKKAEKEAKNIKISNKKVGTSLSHPLKDYTGFYQNPGYGTMEVIIKNDSLFGRSPNKIFWLKHYHYDVFDPYYIDPIEGIDTSEAGGSKIQFESNISGDISSFSTLFEELLKPIEFVKTEKAVPVAANVLKKYQGEYELPGASAKMYVKGALLFAFVPGQPEYEMVPVGEDKFNFKVLEGFSLLFHKNEKGDVIAVSFIQPNGTFKATKK